MHGRGSFYEYSFLKAAGRLGLKWLLLGLHEHNQIIMSIILFLIFSVFYCITIHGGYWILNNNNMTDNIIFLSFLELYGFVMIFIDKVFQTNFSIDNVILKIIFIQNKGRS